MLLNASLTFLINQRHSQSILQRMLLCLFFIAQESNQLTSVGMVKMNSKLGVNPLDVVIATPTPNSVFWIKENKLHSIAGFLQFVLPGVFALTVVIFLRCKTEHDTPWHPLMFPISFGSCSNKVIEASLHCEFLLPLSLCYQLLTQEEALTKEMFEALRKEFHLGTLAWKCI